MAYSIKLHFIKAKMPVNAQETIRFIRIEMMVKRTPVGYKSQAGKHIPVLTPIACEQHSLLHDYGIYFPEGNEEKAKSLLITTIRDEIAKATAHLQALSPQVTDNPVVLTMDEFVGDMFNKALAEHAH